MKKRTKKTKKVLYLHCVKRAKTRYSIDLTRSIYNILNNKAVNDPIYVMKQSNTVSVRLIKYNNQNIAVVYDKKRRTICTFLPKKVIEDNKIIEEIIYTARFDNDNRNWEL